MWGSGGGTTADGRSAIATESGGVFGVDGRVGGAVRVDDADVDVDVDADAVDAVAVVDTVAVAEMLGPRTSTRKLHSALVG